MKKIVLVLALAAIYSYVSAQSEVTIKAGTIIPLQSINEVKAADVFEGQTVDFQVLQDIVVENVCVVPRGALVKGKVTEAKKSTIAGTKGRLRIIIDRMNLDNGEPLFFSNTEVRIYGKNKTPLAVVLACLAWPCIFIPGTKAVMPAGYEVHATVASNVTINK